jgi:hypothetical protein
MAKKKRIKKAVNKKPNWVGEADISKCIPGKVYNIYACRQCIFELKEDRDRPQRKKAIHIPGYTKKQIVEVCPHREPLLIKYKKCPECGQTYWGFYLRESATCKLCGLYSDESSPKERAYYRLKELYKTTIEDLSDPDRWNCVNRDFCLECTYHGGSRKGIACKDCPDYENWRK